MTITYHDVSHFEGAYVPTGPTCAKATQGTGFTDPQYAGIRSRTLAKGWPFLAYHFLAHGNIAAQVDHVVSTIGKGQPIMLDVETQKGQPDSTLTDVLAFSDAYVGHGGLVTLAYIPHWYWSGHWGSPSLSGLTARRIGLVSSLYDHGHADDGPGWDPYGGITPSVWQYTSTPLDTNAFKGTQAQLAELWAHGTGPIDGGDDMTPQDVVNALKADQSYIDLTWRVQAMAEALDTYQAGSMKDQPVGLTELIKAESAPGANVEATADAVAVEFAARLKTKPAS